MSIDIDLFGGGGTRAEVPILLNVFLSRLAHVEVLLMTAIVAAANACLGHLVTAGSVGHVINMLVDLFI